MTNTIIKLLTFLSIFVFLPDTLNAATYLVCGSDINIKLQFKKIYIKNQNEEDYINRSKDVKKWNNEIIQISKIYNQKSPLCEMSNLINNRSAECPVEKLKETITIDRVSGTFKLTDERFYPIRDMIKICEVRKKTLF